MFSQILQIMAPLVLIVALGYFYGRRHQPQMASANQMNLQLFCPALVFSALASGEFNLGDYVPLIVGASVVVLGSGLLLWPLCRMIGISARTFLPPMMFNNSGNLGLPLLLFSFGESVMPIAIVLFIVEMLWHFSLGIYLLDSKASLLKLFKLPMFIAAIAGLGFSFMPFDTPLFLLNTTQLLGQIAIPLMLFSLGIRLVDIRLNEWRLGVISSIAGPIAGVILALIFMAFVPLGDIQSKSLILFAALPPAVLNYMMAEQYQVEPQRVAAIVFISNLASIVIIPLILVWVL
ncbi:AEC family transporter [Alginatibacterium sediminis]|uniref:AEC family transporter n=1 Tax=Alginatibacterium sediminis TaxID=2164068 RepID=A0A420E8K6_9ALTE|nr:AEC family transporter [Alginatibacterium sediminis]RKF15683.1 AEC family transporter [Alginatibacterium sediminis]